MVFHLRLDWNEVAQLGTWMDKLHIIPEEKAKIKSTIFERGKNGSSKYFLIPKALREGLKLGKEASCIRINSKDKVVLAYILNKIV